MSILTSFAGALFTYRHIICVSLNLALLLWLAYSCRKYLLAPAKETGKPQWLVLGLIILLEIAAHILWVKPKHFIYIDEFWYMEAGKNLLLSGQAAGYPKSIGWPFLIMFSYMFGGINNFSAIYAGILLGVLTPVLMYFAAYLLTGEKSVSLVSAALIAFLPYKLVWSATAETVVPSLFFILAAMIFSLLYYKERARPLLWAGAIAWAMASQIRPENLMFLGVFAAGAFILPQERPKLRDFFIPFAAAILLAFANIATFVNLVLSANWIEVDSFGALKGSNMSLANLLSNTLKWGPNFFDGSLYSPVFTAAFIAGAAWLAARRRKILFFLALWFGCMYCFYFSAWFDVYGATRELFPKTKLFMLFCPVLAIAAGYAAALPHIKWGKSYLSAVLAAILIALYGPYYKKANLTSTPRELETKAIRDLSKTAPPDCVIIANAPVLINSVNFYKTVYTLKFLQNQQLRDEILNGSKCVLFMDDITAKLGIPEFEGVSRKMRENFLLSDYASFTQGNECFKLYRVARRAKTLSPPNLPDDTSSQPPCGLRPSQAKK